jgi:8-oxo-dGTP diphosphatase
VADHIAIAVDVVLLTIHQGELSVLLVDPRGSPAQGAARAVSSAQGAARALPGALVGRDEGLDAAARRALADAAGVVDLPAGTHLEQLRTYGDSTRGPGIRVVSVAYVAMVPELVAPEPARFWPVARPPQLVLDQLCVLGDAVERARAKLEYSPLATAFCREPFTLADLRRIYEAVWGVPLDVPNFRRKVLTTPGLVEPVGRTAAPPGGGRPGALYRRGSAALLHPAMLRPGGWARESSLSPARS